MNVNLIEKHQFEKNRRYPNQYYSLKVLISGGTFYPVKGFSDKTAAFNAMKKHYKLFAERYPELFTDLIKNSWKSIYKIEKYSSPFGHIINDEIYSIEGEI